MWVFSSGETGSARNVGVSPGERIVVQKTGIPQARRIVNEYVCWIIVIV